MTMLLSFVLYPVVLVVTIAMVWSNPALSCARQPHMVYVVDEQACLPSWAFKVAQ